MRSISDSSGAVVGSADYTMFGEYRNQTGVTSPGAPWAGFTGEYFAQETGMWHLRARDLHPTLGRFLRADPVSPNAPGTQGYNRYAYVANNPSTWVDPSGYSVASHPSADHAILSLMFAMGGGGLSGIIQCALDERCREAMGLLHTLGSAGENLLEWTAESLYEVFFSTYPHEPKPASPAQIAASLALSNTPVWGDLYDLSIAVTGYDFITGQYVPGWERLVSFMGILPILGVAGANLRYADEFIDTGEHLARYIGKACSFDEETLVTTEDGQIPIKDVDVGDKVLAWDEVTDSTGYFLVTATWAHEDPVTVLLINGETIETTPDHPFLSAFVIGWDQQDVPGITHPPVCRSRRARGRVDR